MQAYPLDPPISLYEVQRCCACDQSFAAANTQLLSFLPYLFAHAVQENDIVIATGLAFALACFNILLGLLLWLLGLRRVR